MAEDGDAPRPVAAATPVSGKVAREERRLAKERAKDAERDAREQQEQQELAALRAVAEAAENAEFEKWRTQMAVEAGGVAEDALMTESQGLLAEFVEHIKARKVVVLEELAAQFGLRASEAVSRVRGLESMGRLTGVLDDRGKFIYISPAELATVADFINARGRVSIAELASRSNDFISLGAAG